MMLLNVTFAAALMAQAPAVAPLEAQPAPSSWELVRQPEGVAFSGMLTPQSTAALEQELRESEILNISSLGGDRESSAILADKMAAKSTRIVTHSHCFSACALYIALSAKATEVGQGSTLLFHNTTAAWMRLLAVAPDWFNADETARMRSQHQKLIEMLAARGIDPAVLDCIDNAVELDFFAIDRKTRNLAVIGRETVDQVEIPAKYDYAWISPFVLQSFGVTNIAFNWTLSANARESYENLKGVKIKWIDTREQCQ